ncbi:hypothetical protein [Helicobacter pylori]|uniref:hypothetical protein n=1 Tax=Helicobacter pylori TaxID=210 RepID=UPI000EAD02BD|nr:hypothetical protein [Helicobacter pylori]
MIFRFFLILSLLKGVLLAKKDGDFFKPLEPTKKYFGSFKIGYLYQHAETTKRSPIRPKNRPPILMDKIYHDASLGFQAGFVGTPRLNIYSIGITFTFYDFTRFLG